jgi:hypothetical protein
MTKYNVEQVRNPHNHSQLGQTGKVVHSRTVDESKVSATRAELRKGMRGSSQASSDVIRVTKR